MNPSMNGVLTREFELRGLPCLSQKSVVITYNQMSIQATDLADALETAGFAVEQPQSIGRTGKQIVIPPDIVG